MQIEDPVQAGQLQQGLHRRTGRDQLEIAAEGQTLVYSYDTRADRTGITTLLSDLSAEGMVLRDVVTHQSSLEEIFVNLVGDAS